MAKEAATNGQPVAANRVGLRVGKISELTMIGDMKPGGADRLRKIIAARGTTNFAETDKVGTVHNMRFAFFDNDTRLLFATAYDGDWDTYIDDFATQIPNELDLLFSEVVGYPGIRSPGVKDFIAAHQIPAAGWYCANPDLTVAQVRRAGRIAAAVESLLDAAS